MNHVYWQSVLEFKAKSVAGLFYIMKCTNCGHKKKYSIKPEPEETERKAIVRMRNDYVKGFKIGECRCCRILTKQEVIKRYFKTSNHITTATAHELG